MDRAGEDDDEEDSASARCHFDREARQRKQTDDVGRATASSAAAAVDALTFYRLLSVRTSNRHLRINAQPRLNGYRTFLTYQNPGLAPASARAEGH